MTPQRLFLALAAAALLLVLVEFLIPHAEQTGAKAVGLYALLGLVGAVLTIGGGRALRAIAARNADYFEGKDKDDA